MQKHRKLFLTIVSSFVLSIACAQVVDMDKQIITLDLYQNTLQVDTITERGSYSLAIKHNKDIIAFDIWKNGKKLNALVWQYNANALHKGIRTRLQKPQLKFAKSTVYRFEIQLNGESEKRLLTLSTRHPDTPKPTKSELGTPVCCKVKRL